jgi:hypothetical protein
MVPSSSIAITADDECLVCGGFSLREPIRLRYFELITDYFSGLSRSPTRGNEGAIFVGSTCCVASTPHRAMIEDSSEEFLTAPSRERRFGHPSPRWRSTGASFAPTTIATWKENAPATTRFPPRMAVPRPETNHPSERHRTHYEG